MIKNIKEIKEKDRIIEDLNFLEKEIFKESYYSLNQILEITENESYNIYVYLENDELKGYLIIYDSLDCYEVMKIGVKSSQRKKSIANQLLKYFLEHNDKDVLLEVRESNIPAISFYKKNAFVQIGIRKNYYKDNNENALIMKLEI